jgi:hypothetical protein
MLTFDLQNFIDSNFLAKESADLARLNRRLKGAVAERKITVAHLDAQIAELNHQIAAASVGKRNLLAEIAGAETELARAKIAAADVAKLSAEAKTKADKVAQLTGQIDRLQAELNSLTGALERAEKKHQTALSRLKAELEQAKSDHAAELETLESERVQRIKAIGLEIEAQESALADVIERQQQIQREIIEGAEREIEISRREFANERQAAVIQLEADRVAVHKELTMAQETVIEKYKPTIEAPLLEQIRLLEIELGKLAKQMTAKQGDNLIWNPDQIREFLLDIDADGDAPSHLRICGATKSGKSFLVNQIISGGLKSLGFDADFTVIDPYHSQTKWAVPPTVKNDPDAAAALIMQWAEACSGEPLTRPAVLVVDELDSLISDYGPELAEAIKTIVKKGRHFGRYFYWLGQNGNVPKKMQWSDVKNFNQIYLGNVADDYAENGLKGRNKNKWLGELEALRDKSKYHALIHCKGANPYTRLLPREYFTTTPPGATAEPAAESTTTAPACPKCGSTKVKKAGNLNGRQRIKCNDCGKQSYAD